MTLTQVTGRQRDSDTAASPSENPLRAVLLLNLSLRLTVVTEGENYRLMEPAGKEASFMVLLREEIGDVLRDARTEQGRTLREVSKAARVSLGYLSEVERGQKEASSELLGSICSALEMPLSRVLKQVSDRVAIAEGIVQPEVTVPDTVPDTLAQTVRNEMYSSL